MKKKDFLTAPHDKLKSWLEAFRQKVEADSVISVNLRDYLFRQINDEATLSPETLLKRRATVILYLNDGLDFTENPHYGEDECAHAIALLIPVDFNRDADCIYCLQNFNTGVELQKHFENCHV